MSAGNWVENDARWFEMRMVYCDLCGRVIAKRGWQVVIEGAPRLFCTPQCEYLYRSYVLKQLGLASPLRAYDLESQD